MLRIQLLAMWLVFTQHQHVPSKEFFTRIRTDEPFGPDVTNVQTELDIAKARQALLGIFRRSQPKMCREVSFCERHTGLCSFDTPYGPNAWRYCYKRCVEPFLPDNVELPFDEPWTPRMAMMLHIARKRHLAEVYGIDARLAQTQTGMPMPTVAPQSPASTHCSLHAAIAQTWMSMSKKRRTAVLEDVAMMGCKVAQRARRGRRERRWEREKWGGSRETCRGTGPRR